MYSLLIANNPELAGDRRKFLMRPPQVRPSAVASPPRRARMRWRCTRVAHPTPRALRSRQHPSPHPPAQRYTSPHPAHTGTARGLEACRLQQLR